MKSPQEVSHYGETTRLLLVPRVHRRGRRARVRAQLSAHADIYAYIRSFKSTPPPIEKIPVMSQILAAAKKPYKQ
jgi:hypothetical protein